MHFITLRVLACLLILLGGSAVQAQPEAGRGDAVTIATGGVTGVYYALASAICRLLDRDPATAAIACEPLPSRGSVANIGHLRWGTASFAIVQTDIQGQAYEGGAPFEGREPFGDLRHVATLHPEALTILQRPGYDFRRALDDTEATPRVFLGVGGSGTRALLRLSERYGFEPDTFSVARDLRTELSVDALCAGRVDVIFYLIGHPNDLTNQATRQCNADLVPGNPAIIDRVVAAERYFRPASIPARFYPNVEDDVATIGIRATLVTSTSTPEALVYAVTRALHEENGELQRLHLAFTEIGPDDLRLACNTAPVHAGAARYFNEIGAELTSCR